MSAPVIDGSMSSNPVGTTPAPEAVPAAEVTPEGEQPKETVPAEVLRQKLTEANAEAAKYRTELRAAQAEAQAALAKANTADEYKAVIDTLNAKVAEMETGQLRVAAALDAGLPREFADRLKGSTEAELKADAEGLFKLVGIKVPSSPSGGLNPLDVHEDAFDPIAAARKLEQSGGVRFGAVYTA